MRSTCAASWTRSRCSRAASGASRIARRAASPEASSAASIAFRRAGASGCPGHISCRTQSGCVKSAVAIHGLYLERDALDALAARECREVIGGIGAREPGRGGDVIGEGAVRGVRELEREGSDLRLNALRFRLEERHTA